MRMFKEWRVQFNPPAQNREKLLCLLLLALPAALLAQPQGVPFDANILVFSLFQNDTVPLIPQLGSLSPQVTPQFWMYYGELPGPNSPTPASINAIGDGSLVGNGLTPAPLGFGITINAGALSFSGLGEGIGYTITTTPNDTYIVLNANAIDGTFPFQHSIFLGFDTPGINIPPNVAVYMANYGLIPEALYVALYNGSSQAWKNIADEFGCQGATGANIAAIINEESDNSYVIGQLIATGASSNAVASVVIGEISSDFYGGAAATGEAMGFGGVTTGYGEGGISNC
jgi:hypothetical protein